METRPADGDACIALALPGFSPLERNSVEHCRAGSERNLPSHYDAPGWLVVEFAESHGLAAYPRYRRRLQYFHPASLAPLSWRAWDGASVRRPRASLVRRHGDSWIRQPRMVE